MSALSNAKWVALTQLVKVGSQLVNMFVLTKLISPYEYGLMAMAGIATNLALILRDLGTAAAIIQKKEITDADISSVFWLNVLMGVGLMLGLVLISPSMATIFDQPKLELVLMLLSVTFPIASASAAHQALLERDSNFRVIAAIESTSSFLALVVALVVAYNGGGVYSLIVQSVLMTFLTSVALWLKSPWRPSLIFRRDALHEVGSYSGGMAGYQLTSYVFRNADSFLIGRMLGVTVLGVYSLAYKIMLFPVQNISWVTSRALFPVMSRMQTDLDAMNVLCKRALVFVSFVTAPLMFGLVGSSDVFVQLLFSSQWHQIGSLLVPLAIVGYSQVIVGVTGPVFMALGRTRLLFLLAIVNAAIHFSAYFLGAYINGAIGLSWAYLLASFFMALPTYYLCARELKVGAFSFVKTLAPSLIGGLLLAGVVQSVGYVFEYIGNAQKFGLMILAGVIFYTIYSILFQRDALGSARTIFKKEGIK